MNVKLISLSKHILDLFGRLDNLHRIDLTGLHDLHWIPVKEALLSHDDCGLVGDRGMDLFHLLEHLIVHTLSRPQ